MLQSQDVGWRRTQVELYYFVCGRYGINIKKICMLQLTRISNSLSDIIFEVGDRDIGRLIRSLMEGSSFTVSAIDCCKLLTG